MAAMLARVSSRPSLSIFLLVLLALDVAVVVLLRPSLTVAGAQRSGPSGSSGPPGRSDDGWALCQTRFAGREVTPASVAITYLDSHLDSAVSGDDMRSWIGGLDGITVDVYKLAHHNGRRRVALEISRGKWPAWEQAAAGQDGELVCSLVRAALLDVGVGRPVPPGLAEDAPGAAPDATIDRSRHDFEFIYARRARLYRSIEWAGTLDQVLEGDTPTELIRWLDEAP